MKLGSCELELGQAQDIGTREEQQDHFAIHRELDGARPGVLLVVADGMGGHRGGAQASVLGVETFVASFRAREPRLPIGPALAVALLEANRAVMAARVEGDSDMGATLCALWLDGRGTFQFVSVGDSPMFVCRDGALTRLNCDHTLRRWLQGALARGRISLEELARRAPEYRYLTSHLGVDPLPEVDLSDLPQPWFPGDHFVLCSDGLTGAVARKRIAELGRTARGQALADTLVRAALQRAHERQDNVTALVASLGATEPRTRPLEPAAATSAGPVSGDEPLLPPTPPRAAAPLVLLLLASLLLNLAMLAVLLWR